TKRCGARCWRWRRTRSIPSGRNHSTGRRSCWWETPATRCWESAGSTLAAYSVKGPVFVWTPPRACANESANALRASWQPGEVWKGGGDADCVDVPPVDGFGSGRARRRSAGIGEGGEAGSAPPLRGGTDRHHRRRRTAAEWVPATLADRLYDAPSAGGGGARGGGGQCDAHFLRRRARDSGGASEPAHAGRGRAAGS